MRWPWSGRMGICTSSRPSAVRRRLSWTTRPHNAEHIGAAFEVIGFVKRYGQGTALALNTPEVQKVNVRPEAFHDSDEVVSAARAQRTGAEAQSVCRRGRGLEHAPEVVLAGNTRGSPSSGHGGSSGVNGQADAHLFGDGYHRPQEVVEVVAQLGITMSWYPSQYLLKLSRA
jgi:hypothetical protein